ncbi:MAG: NTP transferase domain-containing protein [Tetrasphaera sp.]|nr:NTP transferase domain-containing protein [Tetrasphaera sp.]
MHAHVHGLVLAAGQGRRMGGPKAVLRLTPDGPTLVETAILRLRAGGCEHVTAVVGAAYPQVVPYAESAGAAVVVAADWAQGMGASLRCGLDALAATTAVAVVVTLVDLPDVTETVIARVLDSVAATGAGWSGVLARAAYGGRPGHPVVLGRDHWPRVRGAAAGDRGARDILTPEATLLVECGDLATGRDVDRPTDLGS